MTTTTTSGAAIQRYKIGYHSDEWGVRSSTPSGIPDASGSWVRYADHVTALAAGQATAAQQPGAAYAALAEQLLRGAVACGSDGEWVSIRRHIRDQAVKALRLASPAVSSYVSEWAGGICTADEAMTGIAKLYGAQAATEAQAAPAAVAGPSGYGPKVTVKRSCSDCKACNSESYAVQGDSGHYVYCEHPSLPESKYIGDTNWNTPHWCPVAAPTTQPAPPQEAGPSDPSITLDFKMASELLDMFGGEPGLVTLQHGGEKCHSGAGLYAWHSDLPEEGAAFLGAEPHDEAAPTAQPSPAAQGDALDAARLDWLEADEGQHVFHLGGSWYTRSGYGMPYRKRASLRAAIDAARAAQEGK